MLKSLKLGSKSFVNHTFLKIWWKNQHVSKPAKPTCIDLTTTSKSGMLQNVKRYQTG